MTAGLPLADKSAVQAGCKDLPGLANAPPEAA